MLCDDEEEEQGQQGQLICQNSNYYNNTSNALNTQCQSNFLSQATSMIPTSTNTAEGSAVNNTRFAHTTYDTLKQLVRKMDTARAMMGNITLVYTSAVTSRSSRLSSNADVYMMILQYLVIVVLPLSLIASQWGMNCNVPWNDATTLKPFWGLVAVMVGGIVLCLMYPMWCYISGREQKIM